MLARVSIRANGISLAVPLLLGSRSSGERRCNQGVVKYFFDSLVETSIHHCGESCSLKANLLEQRRHQVQRSVIKEAEARLKRAEQRLGRDDDSHAADDDSDEGSKMSRAKAMQTEFSAHSANSFSCKDAIHRLNYLRPVTCSPYKLFLTCFKRFDIHQNPSRSFR